MDLYGNFQNLYDINTINVKEKLKGDQRHMTPAPLLYLKLSFIFITYHLVRNLHKFVSSTF